MRSRDGASRDAWRAPAIGGLLILLGAILLGPLGGGEPPTDVSSYRHIAELSYRRAIVTYGRGPDPIHLVGLDGERYLFPTAYWPDGIDAEELAAVLRADSVAEVWVSDGDGYPVVKGIRTSRLHVDPAAAVPIDRRRHAVQRVAGPAALVLGALVLVWSTRRLRARAPAAPR
jgi:hypothetical protein